MLTIKINDKLQVRPITIEDTDNVVRWRNNERVRNNFLYRDAFTAEIHRGWLETKVASGEVLQFIISEVKTVGIYDIGSVFFKYIDYDKKSAEYGIFIGEDDAVGHDYGNMVAGWAVSYARDVLQLDSLMLRVLADNISAVKSYESAGFVPYEVKENYIDGRNLVFMRVVFK